MPMVIFFFNDTATTEIYTLSLHDALPIYARLAEWLPTMRSVDELCAEAGMEEAKLTRFATHLVAAGLLYKKARSEEHTPELQSPDHLVCPLLLEKKKKNLLGQTASNVILI